MAYIYKPHKGNQRNEKTEKRQKRQKYYRLKQWKDLTLWYKQEHPLCERCLEKGVVKPSEATHHIVSPFQDGLSHYETMALLLDVNNLQALCVDCHTEIHKEEQEKKKMKKNLKNLTFLK